MNFTLLFPIVSLLNFSMDFEINNSTKQDFLYFTGANSSAHLFRVDNLVNLMIEFDGSSSNYTTKISDELRFSWNGFLVNDTEMTKMSSNNNFVDLCCVHFEFSEFTFLSPILNFNDILVPSDCQPIISSFKKVNYGYIVAIVFCVGLLLNIKPKTVAEHFNAFSNISSETRV